MSLLNPFSYHQLLSSNSSPLDEQILNERQQRNNSWHSNMNKGRKKGKSRNHSSSARLPETNANDSIPFDTEFCMSPRDILDLFAQEFKFILESSSLQVFIQLVKGQLYERDYMAAFDNDDKRFAYACRWSPARALAYSSLFGSLEPIRDLLDASNGGHKRALCIGGGASSELVALASVFCRLKEYNSTSNSSLDIQVVDIADWSTIVGNLTNYMKRNWIYKPETLCASFIHGDILNDDSYPASNYSDLDLITLLFTTNELFAEKRKESVQFLQNLNRNCHPGTLLLIAESAGSYSHITVGTKTFPVQFIIDTVLLRTNPDSSVTTWELVQQSDSCWYRINEAEISYPMKLENMRFFYRLYRKT